MSKWSFTVEMNDTVDGASVDSVEVSGSRVMNTLDIDDSINAIAEILIEKYIDQHKDTP